MGVFDHTCALTRTSISVRDPVMLVALHWTDRDLASTHKLLEMLDRPPTRDLNQLFRFCGSGTYDDRGSVGHFDHMEGCTADDFWWNFQFMCHLNAVTDFMGESLQQAEDPFSYLQTFLKQCSQARIELFGHNLLGEQLFDQHELDLQTKLHRITGEVLLRKQKQLEEWDS
ncbi:hypothetical protein [Deinococcus roseus]|uniref:Uncharacterized protein n=1 Tax=Deinococcus roseus TaxID=392414 RepID=A0ABQ2D6G7_9DEIO|nr:hypothetical protein [Deinococcus roseus]GGJ47141.1 hypothetical protein GCM10008938_36520 [Deinococcus roseus]